MSASDQQRQLGRSTSSSAKATAKDGLARSSIDGTLQHAMHAQTAKEGLARSSIDGTLQHAMKAETAKEGLARSSIDGTLQHAITASSEKEAAKEELAAATANGSLPRALAAEADKDAAKAELAAASVDGTLPRAMGDVDAHPETTLKRSQSSPSRPKSQKEIHAEHHHEYTNRLRGQINQGLKISTGASFEERAAAGAARMKKKANAIESRQARMLEEAVARAKQRPIESPVRPKHLEPETVESRVARGQAVMREREREYGEEKADLLYRMKTREPLFRVSEVEAAKEAQRQRQAAYRQELKDDEERRWEMIRGLKEKVLSRPMLVHDYRRPVHATPDQMPPHMGEETELDRKIQRGMAKKSFSESSWAQTVQEIHQRADNRVPLHKIPYPPKKLPEYKPRPKVLSSMDEALEKLVTDPAFKNSEWARTVGDIRQRQDDRPKLHEITYPSKV